MNKLCLNKQRHPHEVAEASQGFMVLLSFLPLGARKQSYIRTRLSL